MSNFDKYQIKIIKTKKYRRIGRKKYILKVYPNFVLYTNIEDPNDRFTFLRRMRFNGNNYEFIVFK